MSKIIKLRIFIIVILGIGCLRGSSATPLLIRDLANVQKTQPLAGYTVGSVENRGNSQTIQIQSSELQELYSLVLDLLVENRRLSRRDVTEDQSNVLLNLANANGFGPQIRPG